MKGDEKKAAPLPEGREAERFRRLVNENWDNAGSDVHPVITLTLEQAEVTAQSQAGDRTQPQGGCM